MLFPVRPWIWISLFILATQMLRAQPDDPRQQHYWDNVRPIFQKHCNSCHNAEDNKAGLNLERYDFIISIVRDGERFHQVMEVVQNGTMPPDIRPPMSQEEKDTLIHYIDSYLKKALEEKDPGIIPLRRLNNQEYGYAIQDLFGIALKVDSIFPADPSGGAGFDNQARLLYVSPLLMERYFETADYVVEQFYADRLAWNQKIPVYEVSWAEKMRRFWVQLWYNEDVSMEAPRKAAAKVLFPMATLAYRRFLSSEEKNRLLDFFEEVYQQSQTHPDGYAIAIKECLKLMLVSHHFLYRSEADPDLPDSYEIGGFELATRLSFFLWSSLPDLALLNAAYREDLHDPKVLEREVRRMLADPKAQRLGWQFAVQWLELKKLKDPAFQMDPNIFPAFNALLKRLMLGEVAHYFNHVLLESQNFLELIDSDYGFLNEELARFYGIEGIAGDSLRKVTFSASERGGLLGMAAVLTATSLPTRTSPVLRGKWVLEQILGTPAPPPPADVPELEASHDPNAGVLTLRQMLERHREDPACYGCHQAMDPIGLGLENFDALGRWREAYETDCIDASGVLKSGESFEGPAELRHILLSKKKLFARNFSKKMLSFALGRSLGFKDSPTVDHLQHTLLEHDFNSSRFMIELVKSFPFRYKKSDIKDVEPVPTS